MPTRGARTTHPARGDRHERTRESLYGVAAHGSDSAHSGPGRSDPDDIGDDRLVAEGTTSGQATVSGLPPASR